jgi:hypothetical protein
MTGVSKSFPRDIEPLLLQLVSFSPKKLSFDTPSVTSIVEYMSLANDLGVDSDHAKKMLCRFFGVKVIDKVTELELAITTCYLDSFMLDNDHICSKTLNMSMLNDPSSFSFLSNCFEYSSNNFKSSSAQTILKMARDASIDTIDLHAALKLETLSDVGVVSVVVQRGDVVGLYGVGRVYLGSISAAIHFPDSSIVSKAFFEDSTWAKPVRDINNHIENSAPGKILCLCGQYLDNITEDTFKVSALVSGNTVRVIRVGDPDFLLKNLIDNDFCDYVVLLSSARNLTTLLFELASIMTYSQIATYWGGHFFRAYMPCLCENCKIIKSTSGSIEAQLLNIGDNISRHYVAGNGCGVCISGIKGVVAAEDDMTDRGYFSQLILDAISVDGFVKANKNIPPYKIPTAYFANKEHTTLLASSRIISANGMVRLADINKLFS